VAIEDGDCVRQLQGRLNGRKDVELLVANAADRAFALAQGAPPDVLLVDLLFGGSEGIALGLDLVKKVPHAELVFVVRDRSAPEVRAAVDLGITRFLEASELPQWFDLALDRLARLARAQRMLDEARRSVGELTWWRGEAPSSPLPLAVAERRYREAFLRANLAKAGGRRMAAKMAGVPYTTFCMMLRKLGIST
jgi:DNA-binding NarL/FixJ family response regulator